MQHWIAASFAHRGHTTTSTSRLALTSSRWSVVRALVSSLSVHQKFRCVAETSSFQRQLQYSSLLYFSTRGSQLDVHSLEYLLRIFLQRSRTLLLAYVFQRCVVIALGISTSSPRCQCTLTKYMFIFICFSLGLTASSGTVAPMLLLSWSSKLFEFKLVFAMYQHSDVSISIVSWSSTLYHDEFIAVPEQQQSQLP